VNLSSILNLPTQFSKTTASVPRASSKSFRAPEIFSAISSAMHRTNVHSN
jgi:hypothetical protein